jgi:hypothetical protein
MAGAPVKSVVITPDNEAPFLRKFGSNGDLTTVVSKADAAK